MTNKYDRRLVPYGSWQDNQADGDRAAHEQRQVDRARDAPRARVQRGQDAMIQLAKAREQLLALSILLYGRARDEHNNGHHETVILLHELAHMARDIRANLTAPELELVE